MPSELDFGKQSDANTPPSGRVTVFASPGGTLATKDSDGNIRDYSPFPISEKSPGPDEDGLIYDSVTDTGYYGVATSEEICDGPTLAGAVGLSAGTHFNDNVEWLKFFVGASANCNFDSINKILYITKQTIRYGLSWNSIYDAGCVYGVDGPGPYNSPNGDTNQNTVVTYSGYDFRVKLLTGVNDISSEWNSLIYRVHTDIPSGQVGDNWAEYDNCDLLVHNDCGDGSYSWCQEESGGERVLRGTCGVADFRALSAGYTNTCGGWRPCLELIQS